MRSALAGVFVALAVVAVGQAADAGTSTWWTGSGNYAHRVGVVITAADALPAGYQIEVTLDHAAMVSSGRSMASGNDVRLLSFNGSAWTELDRVLGVGSAWNSALTKLWFKTQAPIAAGATDSTYYVFYGNPSAGAPPASPGAVYDFFEDFSGPIDTDKWWLQEPAGTSVTFSGGEGVFSGTSVDGSHWERTLLGTISNFTSGFAVESSMRVHAIDAEGAPWWKASMGLSDARMGVSPRLHASPQVQYWSADTGWVHVGPSTMTAPSGSFTRLSQALTPDGVARHYENGVLQVTRTGVDVELEPLLFGLSPDVVDSTFEVRIDDVVIRKFVADEPNVTLEGTVLVTATVASALTFTVAGRSTACNGATPASGTSSTAAAVSLGRIGAGVTAVAAQDLTVSTNAYGGFLVSARGAPLSNGSYSIASVVGTNSEPSSFAASGVEGFGYTTGDPDLVRFAGEKWAALETQWREISSRTAGPATADTSCVAYGVSVATNTPAGNFATTVIYTVVPTY